MALAGLRIGDMNNFLDFHDERDGDDPTWPLGDLTHVRHRTHLPLEIPLLAPVPDWAAEDDRPTSVLPRGIMFASSFHHEAALPRLWVSFPCLNGASLVPSLFFGDPPTVPPTVSTTLTGVRARGFIDMQASRAFISKRFAESLGLNVGGANRRITGPTHELQTRPGGWHTISGRDRRIQFGGIGEVPLVVNFAREGQPARWATVYFMLVEDGPMPRGSSIDFVLHYPFAYAFEEWIRDASHCDVVTHAFQQSTQSLPRFVIPRIAPSEPPSPASGYTEQYRPSVRSLAPARCSDLTGPAATQVLAGQGRPNNGFFARVALLFKSGFAADRLCVSCPEARIEIITRLHNSAFSGHYGPVETAARVQAGYYWHNMWTDIKVFVHSCVTCQLNRAVVFAPWGPGGKGEDVSPDGPSSPCEKAKI